MFQFAKVSKLANHFQLYITLQLPTASTTHPTICNNPSRRQILQPRKHIPPPFFYCPSIRRTKHTQIHAPTESRRPNSEQIRRKGLALRHMEDGEGVDELQLDGAVVVGDLGGAAG